MSTSNFDLHTEIYNGGRLTTKVYDKCHYFTFQIVNFPFNIPASPAYGYYISQLIHFYRACAQYTDLLDRAKLLVQKATQNKSTLLLD